MGIIIAHGDAMTDAAALVEASAWLDEQEFARSYYAAVGGDDRYPLTVTQLELHHRGFELDRPWSHPLFWPAPRDPWSPEALAAVASDLGDGEWESEDAPCLS